MFIGSAFQRRCRGDAFNFRRSPVENKFPEMGNFEYRDTGSRISQNAAAWVPRKQRGEPGREGLRVQTAAASERYKSR